MNRLWVRLSLMLSGVLFFVFFLQFLSIVLLPDPSDPRTGEGSPSPAERAEIVRRLIDFGVLSVVVGLIGGVTISRVISAPVNDLVKAARRIGDGQLAVRVPVRGSRELQDLARTFNKMAADLQQAETLRTNLMADVSHELRTPLAVLEGNLRAALDHVYVLDEAEIANLYTQTRHLIRLVNDLRELSLAEAGQLALEKSPVDLQALAAETLQALEPLAAEKNVRLANEVSVATEVNADPFRLRQVMFNLLSNALRHTPEGGVISVRAKGSPDAMTLSVADTGAGLAAEQLTSIFDRFFRADKSRSRETGGTGLGLAIAKAIITAHGGQIWAESAGLGKGSCFTFSLPRQSD
jgi:signal transduction histidine kinase